MKGKCKERQDDSGGDSRRKYGRRIDGDMTRGGGDSDGQRGKGGHLIPAVREESDGAVVLVMIIIMGGGGGGGGDDDDDDGDDDTAAGGPVAVAVVMAVAWL